MGTCVEEWDEQQKIRMRIEHPSKQQRMEMNKRRIESNVTLTMKQYSVDGCRPLMVILVSNDRLFVLVVFTLCPFT